MKVTLLISTYNRADALDVVLDSVAAQTRMPDEVVICDDGSGRETASVIQRWQEKLPVPVIHVWHEDKGFRLAAIRNKGVAASTGDYIIQIDGDVMLERHFVADHIDKARKGFYIKGSRVRLSPEGSKALCDSRHARNLSFISSYVMRDRAKNFRWGIMGRLYGTHYHREGVAIGCNMSFWRSDFMMVNGYDEYYEGWGAEDTDLCLRLEGMGVRTFKLFRMGLCWHLWHNERPNPNLGKSRAYMMQRINDKKYIAERGINQYINNGI